MGLTNGRIIDVLEQTVLLLELHEENQFKIRGLQNGIFNLEKQSVLLQSLSLSELEQLEGVGKGIASKIDEINRTGTTQELQNLLKETPEGVVEMLGIKGIGPKKVRTLWKEGNITSLDQLYENCLSGKVASIKGFGDKTQETIRLSIEFLIEQKGKFLYSEAFLLHTKIAAKLRTILNQEVVVTGQIRRCMEVVDVLQYLVVQNESSSLLALESADAFETNFGSSGPYAWRGRDPESGISLEVRVADKTRFGSELYLLSSSPNHLKKEAIEGLSFFQYLKKENVESEEAIFSKIGLSPIPAEYREGYFEIQEARENKIPALLQYSDLKGAWHNHSVWSDGKNTLEEMAQHCIAQGWQCFGISDHSQTAIYANGLQEFRVKQQHQEIDILNQKLAPFKIFKGIESDILADGSLDYPDAVLASFDYVVASIHSQLSMTEEKATERLIRAIENPYTTMLGHLTGRLLLRRQGYPVNHKKIIEACAANEVILELNANPWRLDVDWRWIRYALEKGVVISINPDAHEIMGLHDMQYGVLVARKAGLTAEQTFNAWPLEKIEAWLKKKKTALTQA